MNAQLVAAMILVVSAAAGPSSAEGVQYVVGASVEQDLSPTLLDSPPSMIGVNVEQEFEPPRSHVVGDLELPPVYALEPVLTVHLSNGSIRLHSELLGRTLEPPETGFYHDGELHWEAIIGEATVVLNDEVHSELDTTERDVNRATGNATPKTTEAVFDAAKYGADAAPQVGYYVNTRSLALAVFVGNQSVAIPPTGLGRTPIAIPIHEVAADPSGTARLPPIEQSHLPAAGALIPPGPTPQDSDEPEEHTVLTVTSKPPSEIPVGTIVAGAAAVVVALLMLYSLFRPQELLRNGVRGRIYAVIEQYPGISVGAIAAVVGVKHQTVGYHIAFLKKGGFVVDHERGNKRLYFANGAGLNEESRALLALTRDETTMRILRLISGHPGIIKSDVARAVGLARTAGAWHVNKLVKLGLVAEIHEHGRCRLVSDVPRVAKLEQIARSLTTSTPPPVAGPSIEERATATGAGSTA